MKHYFKRTLITTLSLLFIGLIPPILPSPLPEEPGIESEQDLDPGCSPMNDLFVHDKKEN